jgi:dTDP-4-amino-4,6-dideoxygalactose transaminase
MPVPFIDLSRVVTRVREDVLSDWAECLDRCEFVGGPRVATLEKRLAEALGVPRVVTCANGTDALLIGLQALGVGRGIKVALPNLTFWATFEAIVQLGAIPVLIDVDADDLQMSLHEFKAAHDVHRFEAAIFVHLFGWTSTHLRQLRALCKERKIALLEDGAQAFGVEAQNEPVLAGAEVGTMSFYPAKVVGGAMDGGAITLQTEKQERYVRSICNHGRSEHYSYAHVGWNSRMGGLQAAFLSRVLDHLPAILASRRETAAFYRRRLGPDSRLKVFGPPPGVTENGYLSVLTSARKGADVVAALKEAGVSAARTYPETMDSQPPATKAGALRHGELRVSRRFVDFVVNLPLFYGITDEERQAAATALLKVI